MKSICVLILVASIGVLLMFVLTGCGTYPCITHVYIYIHEEYNEQFDAKGFTIDDFLCEAVKEIGYSIRNEERALVEDANRVLVLTMDTQNEQCRGGKAREHLEELKFARDVKMCIHRNGKCDYKRHV